MAKKKQETNKQPNKWRSALAQSLFIQLPNLVVVSVVKNELRLCDGLIWHAGWLNFSESTGSEREKINHLRYRQTAAEIRMAKTVPRHSRESERGVLDVSSLVSLRNSIVTLCRTLVCWLFSLFDFANDLREMSNFLEFAWPWISRTLGVFEIRTWRVVVCWYVRCGVSEKIMTWIRHVGRFKGSQDSDTYVWHAVTRSVSGRCYTYVGFPGHDTGVRFAQWISVIKNRAKLNLHFDNKTDSFLTSVE